MIMAYVEIPCGLVRAEGFLWWVPTGTSPKSQAAQNQASLSGRRSPTGGGGGEVVLLGSGPARSLSEVDMHAARDATGRAPG